MVVPGRYAAIDIGTVTCRLMIADVVADEEGLPKLTGVVKDRAIVNLGEGVDATKQISKEAMERTARAIDGFVATMAKFDTEEHPIISTLVMATSASRDAENADEFEALLAARGLTLTVIPGTLEAALSFMGATAGWAGRNIGVVDSGGGSTEIALGTGAATPAVSHSFDVGCRRLAERYLRAYPPSPEAVEEARTFVRSQLATWRAGSDWMRSRLGRQPHPPGTNQHAISNKQAASNKLATSNQHATSTQHAASNQHGKPTQNHPTLLAVAGTATSAVTIRDQIATYDPDKVDGQKVTLAELETLLERMLKMTLPELENIVGLEPQRAPVICGGFLILCEVLKTYDLNEFTVSESDILDGMIMYNSTRENKGSADNISEEISPPT